MKDVNILIICNILEAILCVNAVSVFHLAAIMEKNKRESSHF